MVLDHSGNERTATVGRIVTWLAAGIAIVCVGVALPTLDAVSAAEQRRGDQQLIPVDRPDDLPRLVEAQVSRRVGEADGPEMLGFRPLGITPYGGGFVVADGRDVRVVGVQDTARQGVIGRRGQGPGEYRSPIFTGLSTAMDYGFLTTRSGEHCGT